MQDGNSGIDKCTFILSNTMILLIQYGSVCLNIFFFYFLKDKFWDRESFEFLNSFMMNYFYPFSFSFSTLFTFELSIT